MTENRVITMFYKLRDVSNNTLLEENWDDKEPISFITGYGQIIPKLEEKLLNLKAGEEKFVKVGIEDGIGEYDEKAIQSIAKEQFAGIDLKEGMELFGQGEDNSTVRVTVKAIGEDEVIVDFNHPYAGKELEFEVKILENRIATEDEIKSGVIAGSGSSCGCSNKKEKKEGNCCGKHHKHDTDHECCNGEHHKHDKEHKCCKDKE